MDVTIMQAAMRAEKFLARYRSRLCMPLRNAEEISETLLSSGASEFANELREVLHDLRGVIPKEDWYQG